MLLSIFSKVERLLLFAGKKLSPVTRVPYFGKYDLLTAASLNGGAVFREYVRMLTNWTNKFSRDVSEEEVREILTRSGEGEFSQENYFLRKPAHTLLGSYCL